MKHVIMEKWSSIFTEVRSRITEPEILTIMRLLWPSMLLEILARILWIPIFPGFAALFNACKHPARRFVILFAVPLIIDLLYLGPGAWAFAFALLTGRWFSGATYGLIGGLRFAAGMTISWSLLDLITNQFPFGDFSIQSLLTALFVRFVPIESLGGIMARFVLSALTLLSIKIGDLFERSLRKFLPAALISMLLVSCGTEREYFQPETASGASVNITFSGKDAGPTHPVVSENARTDQFCLSCHGIKTVPTQSRSRRGFHEIHYSPGSKFDRICVYCHQEAGTYASSGEHPGERARNSWNSRCQNCHSSIAGAPAWSGKYR